MTTIEKIDVTSLLGKPIGEMTGEEFCVLTRYASADRQEGAPKTYAYGIHQLGGIIGCSDSTIHSLKRQGVLDGAIVSQIGKRIIFDVPKARILADEYQQKQRAERRYHK